MSSNQIIIILFGCLYFGFILYTRRKGDFKEFSVAGKSLGTFMIFVSLAATFVGPGFTMGFVRQGFKEGILYAALASFAGVVISFVGIVLGPRIRKRFVEGVSVGDVIGGRHSHNHKLVRLLTGFINFWFLTAACIAMSYAGGELVTNVFGFSKQGSIFVITSVVILYSYFGGIRATIQTDALQFFHFVVLIPLLVIIIIFSDGFSLAEATTQMKVSTSSGWDGYSFSALLGLAFIWSFMSGFDPIIVNRMLASRSDKAVRNALIAVGIFLALWLLLMNVIGVIGKTLHPELLDTDQLLLNLAEIHFPGILYAIFIIAMIGVVMSSQDSILNSAAVVFSEDLVSPLWPSMSDPQKLLFSKLSTIGIGMIAILVAGFVDSILQVLSFVFSYYIPIMVPLILLSVLLKRHYWQAALVSMILAPLSYLLWEFSGLNELFPSVVFALLVNFLSYGIVHLILSKKKPTVSKPLAA